MKPSEIRKAVLLCWKARRPCFIWGAPGIGKSSIVKQLAAELSLTEGETVQFKDTRAIHYDPVDLRGIPGIVANFTKWFPPDFLPRAGKGIWFLDELNAAPLMVQAAFYQLILDRRIGDYELPVGWLIIAAGNRETDRAVTQRMPAPLCNRFAFHLNLDVDFTEWKDWAMENDIVPELIAFFAWRQALLFNFDPQRNDKAFTTPRTVEFLSDLIKSGLDPLTDTQYMAACVGEGIAVEINGFYRIKDALPDIDATLANPAKAKIPMPDENVAATYAFCGAIARRATKKNMAAVITLANRLPGDFSVLLVKDIIKLNKSLAGTEAYNEWAQAHQNVML